MKKRTKPIEDTQEIVMPAPVPNNRMVTPNLVTVRAVGPMNEAGRHFNAGDTFETTAQRAASLGNLVTTL